MKVISVRISQSIWNHIWSSGKKEDFFPDGIYTGFLSDDKQADRILKFMDAFAGKDTLILTDPVMGDDGSVYRSIQKNSAAGSAN